MLIGRNDDGSLGVRNFNADELRGKAAGLARSGVPLLAAVGILILAFAGNLEFLRHVAALHRHVAAVGRISETVAHHTVDQGAVAEPVTETCLLDKVRSLAHALHPSGDHDLCITAADQQGREIDGLQRRRADLVDGQRRDGGGQPGPQRRLAGRDLAHACGNDRPHDDLVHLSTVDPGAVEHLPDDGGT